MQPGIKSVDEMTHSLGFGESVPRYLGSLLGVPISSTIYATRYEQARSGPFLEFKQASARPVNVRARTIWL
jgi:hypothetical protein